MSKPATAKRNASNASAKREPKLVATPAPASVTPAPAATPNAERAARQAAFMSEPHVIINVSLDKPHRAMLRRFFAANEAYRPRHEHNALWRGVAVPLSIARKLPLNCDVAHHVPSPFAPTPAETAKPKRQRAAA